MLETASGDLTGRLTEPFGWASGDLCVPTCSHAAAPPPPAVHADAGRAEAPQPAADGPGALDPRQHHRAAGQPGARELPGRGGRDEERGEGGDLHGRRGERLHARGVHERSCHLPSGRGDGRTNTRGRMANPSRLCPPPPHPLPLPHPTLFPSPTPPSSPPTPHPLPLPCAAPGGHLLQEGAAQCLHPRPQGRFPARARRRAARPAGHAAPLQRRGAGGQGAAGGVHPDH